MSAYPATTDPTAVVGRRFGAYVIDAIVIAALSAGLFFLTAGIELWERPTTCAQLEAADKVSNTEDCTDDIDVTLNDDEYSAAVYKPTAWLIAGGASLLYVIVVQWVIQGLTGATLGKAIFGIRTVNEEGQAPGLGKQFIRGVLWIVDGLCNGLVAAILILVTKGHRRLGDMAAKTFVVRSGAKGSAILVPGMDTGATPGYGTTTPYTPPAPGTAAYTPPVAPPPSPTDQTTAYAAPTASAAPTAPAAPPPEASGPQWDAARNAYIQWDPSRGRWLTYDDAAAEWKPIEGEQPPPPA